MSRTINVSCEVFDHPIFSNEPFGFREALVWLSDVWTPSSSPQSVLRKFKWKPRRLREFLRAVKGALDGGQFDMLDQFCKAKLPRPAISKKVRGAVIERDGMVCRYCRATLGPFHFDHIKPWSRGGAHTVANLTIACAPCNMRKGDRTLAELGWSL